jgi:hypothetical protein
MERNPGQKEIVETVFPAAKNLRVNHYRPE